ncbi:hypothetical protein [Lactococcus lactis]|uniref:hypothetical protein n=1 Tax=Lactococcus lactis TaxID=1358 RepID=UPI00223BBD82|nr:hypothetical protein [Lactococcus lactis]
MSKEDYEMFDYPSEVKIIKHRITEKEKQEFGEEHAKRYGFGSVKQWRTVMMIEALLDFKDMERSHCFEPDLKLHDFFTK